MTLSPAISVVIPTRARPGPLARCISALAGQTLAPRAIQIIVVFDGPAEPSRVLPDHPGLITITAPRLGNAHAKNVGIEAARAPVVLFLNDDVLPAPGLLAAHLDAHAPAPRPSAPAMVLGHSPFVRRDDDTLFHRLIRETSMVFFYDRMIDRHGRSLQPADHDWGYRHAWTLNLSVPREALLEVGGFRPALANCCYEDVELGWRLSRELGAPLLFRPDAAAPHDHRFTPEAYLDREHRLGYSAFGFAHAAPDCARHLFGRDILAPDEVAYAWAFLEHEAGREADQLRAFAATARMPASAADLGASGDSRPMQDLCYTQHVPLKKLAFRRGFMHAASGGRLRGLFHPADALPVEPLLRAAVEA